MRTACLVLSWSAGGRPPPLLARLVGQVRVLGAERIVLLGPGQATAAVADLPGDVEVAAAGSWAEALETLADLAGSATSLDLLDAGLVVSDALLEHLLLPPGDGALAPTAGTAGGGIAVDGQDGRIADVEVGAPRDGVAPALHVGPGAIPAVAAAVRRLVDALPHVPGEEVLPAAAAAPGEARDLLAWVLRAAVRSGVEVATLDSAGLVVRRSATEDEATAREDLAEVDEEAWRLRRAVKARDGFFTTYFVSPYSRYLARSAARRGLTPDQVTVGSLLVGLVAAGAFALGTLPWLLTGALALQAAFTLDCVDGQLARYARRFSARGAWLDAVFDRAKEYAVYAGLAAGAVRTGDDATVWWLAGTALALQVLRHHLDFAFTVHREARQAPLPVRPLDEPATGTDVAEAVPAPAPWARGGLLGAARRLEGVPGLRWGKLIVILPIGERFAAISLGAVLLGARGTFVLLLAWGTVAALYLATGRLLRSLRTPAPADPRTGEAQAPFLDLGPLARRLPALAAPGGPLAAVVLALGVAAPLVALAAPGATGAVVAAGLLAGLGLSRARPPRALDWLVPPALRAVEYGGVLALAWATGSLVAAVAAFALVVGAAYHHYDVVYRERTLGAAPPRWLVDVLGGWEGRLAVVLLASLAGVLGAVTVVLAVWCGGVAVVESAVWWRRATR